MNLKTMFFTSQTALLVRSLRNKHQLLLFPQLVPIFPLYLYCSSSSNYNNFQLPRHPLAIGHSPTGSPFSAAQFALLHDFYQKCGHLAEKVRGKGKRKRKDLEGDILSCWRHCSKTLDALIVQPEYQWATFVKYLVCSFTIDSEGRRRHVT